MRVCCWHSRRGAATPLRRATTAIALVITFGFSTAAAQTVPTCDPDAPLANDPPTVSPDERYTIYTDCFDADATTYTVYAYDAETDATLTLGETAPDTETVWFPRWLDNTRLMLRSETGGGTYNFRSVYVADLDAASLTEVARGYIVRPTYFEEPERLEWATEDGETRTVYDHDFETDETTILLEEPCERIDAFKCAAAEPRTNAGFTEDGVPTLLALAVGDAAMPKTIEIRVLPSGERLYVQEALDRGGVRWEDATTITVFNITFDLMTNTYTNETVDLTE